MSLHRHCNVTIHAQTQLRHNYRILTHYVPINVFELTDSYIIISSSQDANHKIVHTWALVCSGCVHQNAQQC